MNAAGVGAAPRLCFFGTYPQDYTVTRALRQSALAAGFAVDEVHQPLWERTRTKDQRYFAAMSVVRLGLSYVTALLELRRQLRAAPVPAVYLAGFQGQLDTLALRWLRRQRTPILFAPLVTLTETLIEDRQLYGPRSLFGRLVRYIDRLSMGVADHVIVDTEAHRQYVMRQFGVDAQRISTWHLGADNSTFKPRPYHPSGRVRVLFFGSFLPLHGIDTILAASSLLQQRRDIDIVLLGEGPGAPACEPTSLPRPNLQRLPWVPYADLPAEVGRADICLGCFGTGTKASMVIPNKVYQAAAVGRAVITADSPAIREIFTSEENIALCPPGDAAALAAAIVRLADAPERRRQLGDSAAAVMQTRFSDAARGERLRAIVARGCFA